MAELRYLTDEMNAFVEGRGGRVVVGTMIVGAAKVLPLAVARLKQKVPKVLITIQESNTAHLYPALSTGDLDVVVGRLPDALFQIGTLPLEHHLLFSESLFVVGGTRHWNNRKERLMLRDLIDEAWILPPVESPARAAAQALFHEADLQWPADVVESLSILTSLGLMFETPRISLMPLSVAHHLADAGIVVLLDVAERVAFGAVGYSVRAGHSMSAARLQFIECLREAVGEVSQESTKPLTRI
jgi:DNA-binding transcriptional LysR family regulator